MSAWGGILRTHMVARRVGKPPYFFSRFNFERMKEKGNTHFCFHCMGSFKLGPNGEPTDTVERGTDWLKQHDATHADGVVGNADRYKDVWSWLEGEIKHEFPFLVSVPSV